MTDDRDYDALAAKLAAAERRERQLLDTTATCRMLLRELNTAKAKLAEAERVARYESDIAQQALDQMRAAEAALPAVYRLGLNDAHRQVVISGEKHAGLSAFRVTDAICAAIRALPTPTAVELMARIQKGEKE